MGSSGSKSSQQVDLTIQGIEDNIKQKAKNADVALLSRMGLVSVPRRIVESPIILENLRELNLSENAITNGEPFVPVVFANLTVLNLANNKISSIKTDILNSKVFPKITKLVLKNNKLTEFACQGLSTLQNLDLSVNNLTTFLNEEEVKNLQSLKTLILHQNQIKELPAALSTLPNLATLDLRNNGALWNLPAELTSNPKIEITTEVPYKVVDKLYMGGMDTVMYNMQSLKNVGITHVLTVCHELPKKYTGILKKQNIKHKRIDIDDEPTENMVPYFEDGCKFVEEGVKTGGCYIHCRMGISRSATMVICFLMEHNQIAYKDAYKIVKDARPIIEPNPGFVDQLMKVEERMKGKSGSPKEEKVETKSQESQRESKQEIPLTESNSKNE